MHVRERYPISMRKVGILSEQTVESVDMPRARFLELVERTINQFAEGSCQWPEEEVEALRKEVGPVVQEMIRYPLQTWMNSTRGCGCVVGEYIVATSELSRAEINQQLGAGEPPGASISDLLTENPHADILLAFGYAIDQTLSDEVAKTWLDKLENIEIIG